MADADYVIAQDTFVAEDVDGHSVTVAKGSMWHAGDPVVAVDEGRGLLFRSLGDTSAPHPVAEG